MTWHLIAPSITMVNLGQLAWYGDAAGYMGNWYMALAVIGAVQWWRNK